MYSTTRSGILNARGLGIHCLIDLQRETHRNDRLDRRATGRSWIERLLAVGWAEREGAIATRGKERGKAETGREMSRDGQVEAIPSPLAPGACSQGARVWGCWCLARVGRASWLHRCSLEWNGAWIGKRYRVPLFSSPTGPYAPPLAPARSPPGGLGPRKNNFLSKKQNPTKLGPPYLRILPPACV